MDKSNGAFPVLDASLRALPYFDGPCFSMFLGQLTRLQFGSGSVTVCLSFRMPPLPPSLPVSLCLSAPCRPLRRAIVESQARMNLVRTARSTKF